MLYIFVRLWIFLPSLHFTSFKLYDEPVLTSSLSLPPTSSYHTLGVSHSSISRRLDIKGIKIWLRSPSSPQYLYRGHPPRRKERDEDY
jgi:hypothetical protein